MRRGLRARLFYRNPGRFLHGRRERVRFALVALGLLLVSHWVGENVLIEPASKWYLDFQLRRLDKAQEQVTRIVRIDEVDYAAFFGGCSPLPGVKIAEAVCAIAARGPAVVVVDLDTSSPSAFPEDFQLPAMPVPVVWAVDTVSSVDPEGRIVQKADPVLGGRLAVQPLYGVAKMPQDFDGLIRRWSRVEEIDGHRRPTLPWKAVQQYCRGGRATCARLDAAENDVDGNGAEGSSTIPFTTDIEFADIRLSELVPVGAGKTTVACPSREPDPRFADRIVVLGGFYARDDRHQTSWGTRRGTELIAMAIEQVFRPEPLHTVAAPAKWTLKILLALLIALIHHRLRPLPATAATVLLLPVATVVLGELLFQLGSYDVGIVAFAVGILIEQLVTGAERAEHLAAQAESRPSP